MAPPAEDSSEHLSVFPDDRFSNVARIDAGRNATIFSAWDRNLRRRVALKVAAQDRLLDAAGRERLAELGIEDEFAALVDDTRAAQGRYTLLREARLLALVDHPNVIPVLDIGYLPDGALAVVMPLLTGGTLQDQPPTERWQDVLEVALEIGEGLAAIHGAGLLHRDFKPNNVLFDGEGRPRIADLGLACRLDDTEAMAELVGTLRYVAPEVHERRGRDQRDDLYAYCMVVFEMFYGHAPFASVEAQFDGKVSEIRRRGGMPPRLREVLVKGLHPDPEQRWPDMRTLLDAMERASRPWRTWGWAAAASLVTAGSIVAALVLGVFAPTRTVEAEACEEIASELAQVWSVEARAELREVLGTRMAGDNLQNWASRWAAVRAQECEAAKRAGHSIGPTPCTAKMRDHFEATLRAFRTPHMREGLEFAAVIAELPAPERCLAHPNDGGWGEGEPELRELDIEVRALVLLGDLDNARARQAEYMELAQAQGSEFAIARAAFWGVELRRLAGALDEAEPALEQIYREAQRLDAPELAGEAMMKLTAIAGARRDMGAVDAHALAARGVFEEHAPDRVAELLQVQGLALMSGPKAARARGIGLLREAIELREDQLREDGGTRELLSQAHESYARGLVAVGRAGEALAYLDRALDVHQVEYGHGTWRKRGILREKFLALVQLGRPEDAAMAAVNPIMLDHIVGEDWRGLVGDARWFANQYASAGHEIRAVDVLLEAVEAMPRGGTHELEAELELMRERQRGPQ